MSAEPPRDDTTPLRRELTAERDLSPAELRAFFPEGERLRRFVLRRPAGSDAFHRLPDGAGASAGDALVLYALDRSRPADLDAVNADFSGDFYVNSLLDVWPDERALIERVVPTAGADVLEICCGSGRVTTALVRGGNRVTAVDKNADCIEFAAATDRLGITYLVGDAVHLPFPDRRFEVAACFENSLGVLFEGRAAAVAELLRVCRDGGRVLLGFREVAGAPDGGLHSYSSASGHLELAQTFTRPQALELIDSLPTEARARVAGRELEGGDPRPWGGVEFFLVLTVG